MATLVNAMREWLRKNVPIKFTLNYLMFVELVSLRIYINGKKYNR